MSLFAELKRRNVFRVGVAYLVVAWLLIQVADVMIDNIGAPDWLFQAILMVLAIGFPVVLIFAWAFELTPDGIRKGREVDPTRSIAGQTGRKLDRAIIVVLVIALGYFIWERQARGPDESQTTKSTETEEALDKSIAVLPFVNMSADADNEYFSDGLSEELLNLLAKVDGLKVAARTSTFKFKNSEADIADIGQKLNVATVLEGSVRKAGDQVRITAQLIKVDDGFHLWSETYDRSLDNIFVVQDEIATAIVEALKLPLLGQGAVPLETHAAANFEAYDLYLLGRHHLRNLNEASLERALEYFTQATANDPQFAPAWSGIADAYLLLADYGTMETATAFVLATKAQDKALALDPKLPEALTARGNLMGYQSRDSEARAAYEQALRVNPNYVQALSGLSAYLFELDPERAMELTRRSLELDPLDEEARLRLAGATAAAGDRDAAEAMIREIVLEAPENPNPYEWWGQLLRRQGLPHLAIPKFRMAHQLRPGDTFPAWMIANQYAWLEDLESAREWAEIANQRGPKARWSVFAQRLVESYEGHWETLRAALEQEIDTSPVRQPGALEWLGYTQEMLGRAELAEGLYREAISIRGKFEDGLFSEDYADTLASLINLLPAGEERERLTAELRAFSQRYSEVQPQNPLPYLYQAYLATFDNDRDAAMAALANAIDKGLMSRISRERNPILQRWKNDPLFREQMLRMKQDAAEMRAQLEASDAERQLPVKRGNA